MVPDHARMIQYEKDDQQEHIKVKQPVLQAYVA